MVIIYTGESFEGCAGILESLGYTRIVEHCYFDGENGREIFVFSVDDSEAAALAHLYKMAFHPRAKIFYPDCDEGLEAITERLENHFIGPEDPETALDNVNLNNTGQ